MGMEMFHTLEATQKLRYGSYLSLLPSYLMSMSLGSILHTIIASSALIFCGQILFLWCFAFDILPDYAFIYILPA